MKLIRHIVFALCVAVLLAAPAQAVNPDEMLDDPVLEQRARKVSQGLRCLVCQNQSIDDSDAPLARDLRLLVRERLLAGDEDEQVINFLVARYGEFILLKPRFRWHTVLLWLGPLAVLAAGAISVVLVFRRAKAQSRPSPLSSEEQRKLAEILDRETLPEE